MRILESHLVRLQSNPTDPLDVVHDIKHCCFQGVGIDQLGLICSLLFRSENNIIKYLENSVRSRSHKDTAKVRESLFVFIGELLQFAKKNKFTLQEYVLEILNCCVSLFRRDATRVRSIAVSTLRLLLEYQTSLDGQKLDIANLTDLILTEYNCGKCSQSLKAEILELLGTIFKCYPQDVLQRASTVQALFLDTLQSSFEGKTPSMSLIAAAMSGLNSLLQKFSADFQADTKNVQSVYKYICFSVDPPGEITRFQVPTGLYFTFLPIPPINRSPVGLTMIKDHARIFKNYLTEDSAKMFGRISKLCSHRNKPLSHRAFLAMNEFLIQVSHEVVSTNRSEEANIKTFKFFIRNFVTLMDPQATSTMSEISVALRGFGTFSGAILRFSGVEELKKRCSTLFEFSERFLSSDFEQLDETAYHLPSFLIAFSNMILLLDVIDEQYIEALERLLSAVFVFYPQLRYVQRTRYAEAISRLFTCLFTKGSALKDLLSRVVFKGIAFTCTKPTQTTTSSDTVPQTDVIEEPFFKQYVPLWKSILQPPILEDLELPQSKRDEMCKIIYDQLISNILCMVKRLDIKYSVHVPVHENEEKEEKDGGSEVVAESDNLQRLVPSKPTDFEVFFNLVDFAHDILLQQKASLFVEWVYMFSRDLIRMANQYPLISGFYKLLTIAMTLCDESNYFDGLQASPGTEGKEGTKKNRDCLICFKMFDTFRKEVEFRVHQYKNELLAACIQFVLSVPRQFLTLSLPISAVQMALKMGLSYINLAHIGLQALEGWLKSKPEMMEKQLSLVLPLLNDYLSLDTEEYEEKVVSRYEKSFMFKQRVSVMKKSKGKVLEQTETMRLQTRILRLLGRLGGLNMHLIPDTRTAIENSSSAIAWDNTKRVRFHMPFKGIKPELFLDGFIPRVVEIAESSTDRQSKVAACEFLHAIVLYMIGTSAFKQTQQTQFYKLYQRTFPALLRLCTSTEPVAIQLFRPLVFQLIFWFTKNQQYENADTMTLLDAIIDAVGNIEDGALREFSAECLSYFMQCSLESGGSNGSEESPLNVKSLFKRLYSLAHHPEPYKRVGCALTFNKVYRMFRTAENIVDEFIFEIQSNLLFSLRLAAKDDPSMKTQEIISSAVRNITRIIVVYAKAGKLIKKNSKRREFACLSDFVEEEIFTGTNRPEDICRRECMDIFVKVTPYLSGIKSPHAWIQKKLQLESIQWLLMAYEGDQPSLIREDPSQLPYASLLSFLTTLSSLVDSYDWMFREEFIDPTILLAGKKKSCLFKNLAYFIKSFSLAHCFPHDDTMKDTQEFVTFTFYDELSAKEMASLHDVKTQLIIRLFRLFRLILEKYSDFYMPEEIYEHSAFYQLLFSTILSPGAVGFTPSQYVTSPGRSTELSCVQMSLCCSLLSKLSSPKKNVMNETLKQFLRIPYLNILSVASQKSTTDSVDIQSGAALVDGYRTLYKSKILRQSRFAKFTASLSGRLFSELFHNCYAFTPSQLLVGRNVFALCVELEVDVQLLLRSLLDDEVLMDNGNNTTVLVSIEADSTVDPLTISRSATKGSIFYQHFTDQICSFLIDTFSISCALIVSKCAKETSIMWTVLFGILDLVVKQVRPSVTLLTELSHHVHMLSTGLCEEHCTHQQKENILDLCKRIVMLNTSVFLGDLDEGFTFIKHVFLQFQKEKFLGARTKGLDLLSALLSTTRDISSLKAPVSDLLIYHFPSKFTDIPKGCSLYAEIQDCLESLFHCLHKANHLFMVEILLPLLRYEEDHAFTQFIIASWKSLIDTIKEEKALEFFAFALAEVMDDSHKDQLRMAIASVLCVPLLHQLSVDGCISAVSGCISNWMAIVTNPLALHTQSPETNHTDLTFRTCIFMFLQCVFDVLPSKSIKEELNHLYCAKESEKKNEMTTAIMKAAHSAKSKRIEGTSSTVIKHYQQTAYNTLASVVICTQTIPNFFRVFFFKENPAKQEFIWEHIVDTSSPLQFDVETQFPSMKSYSEQIRSRTSSPSDGTSMGVDGERSARYISSQVVMETSLSQDISYISSLYNSQQMKDSDVTSNTTYENISVAGEKEVAVDAKVKSKEVNKEDIELDIINQNPCMASLLRLVDHMYLQFGHSYKDDQMPDWMNLMHSIFTNGDAHPTILIFLGKLIINRPALFQKYATHWIEPLMTLGLSSTVSKGFNYYFRDLCITLLLRWNVVPKGPSQERLASLLFSQMIANIIYNSRFIIKSNIEIAKLFVERWKGHFIPSKKLILDMIAYDDKRSSAKIQRIVGLQLLGILVGNGLPFYDNVHDKGISASQLSTFVSKNLLHPYKDVYSTAAEVCGLIFQNEGMQGDFAQMIKDNLNRAWLGNDHATFLHCLEGIGRYAPEFSDLFFVKLFSLLPKLIGPFRVCALQIIRSRVQHIEDLYRHMKPVLDKVTTYHDENAQLLALEIFIHLVDDLDEQQTVHYVRLLGNTFASHKNHACRLLYYQLLMKLFDKEMVHTEDSIRIGLLKGLSDTSEEIRKVVLAFWNHPDRLSPDIIERTYEVFEIIYSVGVEKQWVQSALELLLALTKESPDYDMALFEPLSDDVSLNEYRIDHAWNSRSLPMSPLFSSQSQMDMDMEFPSQRLPSSQNDTPSPTKGPIRFTPTVGATGTTMTDVTMAEGDSVDTEGFQIPKARFAVTLSPTKSNSNSSSLEQNASLRIPRRFMNHSSLHPSQSGNIFAKKALRNSAKQETYLRKARERRHNRIEIIRTYRKGDHCPPDVQIKAKEIILPLLSLIRKDEMLARQVFPTLFQSIMNSVAEQERDELIGTYQNIIEKIFTHTAGCPSLVSVLLEICYDQEYFIIEPKLIYSASLSSYNYHRGILLLEKQILRKEELAASSSSKRKKSVVKGAVFSSSNRLDDEWMQLIKLYKALEDEDVLLGLYDRLCSTAATKNALEAELQGNYKQALLTYEKALDDIEGEMVTEEVEFESSIWEQSRLECMNKLLMWDVLAKNTLEEVDNDGANVWQPEYREPYLAYFVESHIKNRDLLTTLMEFVDQSSSIEEHRSVLESKFLPEMSLLQICCNDFDKSRSFITKYYQQFIQKWSSIHPLAFVSKRSLLKDIQPIVEMDEFLYFFKLPSNFESSTPLDHFLTRWRNRYPSSDFSDITAWDTVVGNRNRMLEKFYEKFSDLYEKYSGDVDPSPVSLSGMKKDLVKERGAYYLSLASAARRKNNIAVAEMNLRLSFKNRSSFSFPFFIAVAKMALIKARQSRSFEKYTKALEYLEERKKEPVVCNSLENSQNYCSVQAKIFHELAALVEEDPSVAHDTNLLAFKTSSTPSAQLYSKAFRTYEKSCKLLKDESMEGNFTPKHIAKSFVNFALFCDSMLQKAERSDETLNPKIGDKYSEIVVSYLLQAMKIGSPVARDRFPRLLHLLEAFPSTSAMFDTHCASIPCWMFIRWISQMVGVLNKQAAAVIPILERIAIQYPNALFYPFKISSETLTDSASKLCSRIKSQLHNPLLDDFIQALGKMTHPEHRFKDWAESLKPLIQKRKKPEIRHAFVQMCEDLFDPKLPNIGSYNKKFATTWQKAFFSKFGSDGAKLEKMDINSFLKLVGGMVAKMNQGMEPSGTANMKLSKFSGWLVSYDQSNLPVHQFIEKPGQYHGSSVPLVDSHVKISSFDSDTLVMGSLRKPKRLKVRGNDQQDYPYLVKGGEDLRLDQRVQQLFSVMNEIFATDSQCTRRHLSLPTYQVIPMTSTVGLIEWIDNTKPLKGLIEDELAKESPKGKQSLQTIPAAEKRQQWLNSFSKSSKLCDTYFKMYEKADRKNCMRQVESQNETIPWNLLRRAVFSLCATPEAYITIRSHFTRSLAAFNTCSYVIGIGDRHLDNFLLNYKDGAVVGIDFGHAFGTATQFLPIPELVPFRLTNQFTNFLRPLQSQGLLNHNMIHCLRALRENKDVLLNTMNVFITEPLLDWEKLARRCANEQGDGSGSSVWFPKEKIRVATKKLDGFNPAHILIEELKTSVHGKRPYVKHLEKIVAGVPSDNIRAQVGERCDSVAEQVNCLVDLATDPNVLGRMYGGWAPWI